ncbi:hypothetical protein RRG08_055741 [Elysia crispata]|uniref:Uncharacterized protein n=1 Tax=Elysia crispata TaxID=231223 RepID=A0AAE1E7L0_9GAST|nr:hypothetical protein RRG08_055741 [Elysia crispata]
MTTAIGDRTRMTRRVIAVTPFGQRLSWSEEMALSELDSSVDKGENWGTYCPLVDYRSASRGAGRVSRTWHNNRPGVNEVNCFFCLVQSRNSRYLASFT